VLECSTYRILLVPLKVSKTQCDNIFKFYNFTSKEVNFTEQMCISKQILTMCSLHVSFPVSKRRKSEYMSDK
jgi:hypothetical protein